MIITTLFLKYAIFFILKIFFLNERFLKFYSAL